MTTNETWPNNNLKRICKLLRKKYPSFIMLANSLIYESKKRIHNIRNINNKFISSSVTAGQYYDIRPNYSSMVINEYKGMILRTTTKDAQTCKLYNKI